MNSTIELDSEKLGFLISLVNDYYCDLNNWIREHEGEESLRMVRKKHELDLCYSVSEILESAER